MKESDGTIRFARNFRTRGEQCTMNAILAHDKCSCDIDIDDPLPVEVVQEWLQENNIQVLNIAGNTERQAPGIEKIVVDYLIKVLQEPATVGS